MISEVLSSYNVPIYEMINKEVDFTFAYTFKKEEDNPGFKTLKMSYYKIGPFILYKRLHFLIRNYDVVIISTHFKLINLIVLPFLPHKKKIVSWSIGRYITYNIKYSLEEKPSFKDRILISIHQKSDACIVYMPQAIQYWEKYGKIDKQKYFVAHNTVKVADFSTMPPFEERNTILFIGTLYVQKGIGELLTAYSMAQKKNDLIPKLVIIGKGPEEANVKDQLKNLSLEDSVDMVGAIYNEEELKKYFLKALLCISPKQAGLSVQKSLGYGTPFVTRHDAITGGEKFDIKDKYNGFLYSSIEELAEIILKTKNDSSLLKKMSNHARNYYINEASPQNMVQGVLDAISYALHH